MSQRIIFNRVIIIGLGMMGGSLAKAIHKAGCCFVVAAYDPDPNQLSFAINHNLIDQTYNFGDKIQEDDLVIIAAPLSKYKKIVKDIAPNLNKHAIITDIGSLKFFVEKDIIPILGKNAKNFIPCHPIAGSEKSGIRNSDGELFLGKKIIITKSTSSSDNAVEKLLSLWNEIGALPQFLTAKQHDQIFALVSHLPQFLSFVAKKKISDESKIIIRHSRLQNSNSKIWKDIFSLNENNLNHYLRLYLNSCAHIKNLLNKEHYGELLLYLENIFDLTSKFGFIYEAFPKENQQLILERILLTSCYVSLPDIAEFRKYSGTGFRDFVIILSYLKYFLKDHKFAVSVLEKHQKSLIKSFTNIESKINKYEFN